MTTNIVNLRRARKAKARQAAETVAAQRRQQFGTAKATRLNEAERKASEDRRFEAHRLEASGGSDDADER